MGHGRPGTGSTCLTRPRPRVRHAIPSLSRSEAIVASASVSTHTPFSGSIWSEPAVPAGQPVPERDNAFFVGAGPGFFETMPMHLLAGRQFADRNTSNRPGVPPSAVAAAS
jgi:hypothetical protein